MKRYFLFTLLAMAGYQLPIIECSAQGLDIKKSVADAEGNDMTFGGGSAQAGDELTYTITVKNTGNADRTGVAISDPIPEGTVYVSGSATGGGTLTAGTPDVLNWTVDVPASGTVEVTFKVRVVDDVSEIMFIDNIATVDGEETDLVWLWVDFDPLTVIMSTDRTETYSNIGDIIEYTISVTNTSTVTLKEVKVNAPGMDSPDAWETETLLPGDTKTITAYRTLTESNFDNDYVSSLALVGAKTLGGRGVFSSSTDPDPCTVCGDHPECPNCTFVPLVQKMELEVLKKADRTVTYSQVGDIIEYEIIVTNTGNTMLWNIVVEDAKADDPDVGDSWGLWPGDSEIFTAQHTVTPADLAAGYVYNLATVSAENNAGDKVITDESTDPDPCTGCPVDPGCPTCTIVPIVPSGSSIVANPSLSITKSADRTKVYSKEGDAIEYAIIVTNTGNVTLTDITVSDANAVLANGGSVGTLAPNATATITASHAVTQPDLDRGFVYNLATVTGKDPSNSEVSATSTDPNPCAGCTIDPTCPSCTVVPMEQNGKLSVTKSADRTKSYSKVGDAIEYEIVVTNTGNVTLTNVKVSDANAVLANGGSVGTLAPNATVTITASHSVTQPDLDLGFVYNLATATGKDSSGADVTAASTDPSPCGSCPVDPVCPACTIVPMEQNGKLSVTKSADRTKVYSKVGDVIGYEIIVTNTGNVTLSGVTVSDAKAVLANGGSVGTLAPNATATITASHSVTQDDIDNGYVYNLATVKGDDPSNSEVTATSTDPTPCSGCTIDPNCPACTVVPMEQNGKLSVTKSADRTKTYSKEGDVIEYAIIVTNTGNVTLSGITVSDANAVLANGGSVGTLAPNATATITASHAVSQDDLDRGFVYNLATATGKDPSNAEVSATSTDPSPCAGCTVDPNCPACTIVPMEQNGKLSVTKSADRTKVYNKVGDVIGYEIVVRNAGNVTLSGVTVSDANAVLANGGSVGTLAPNGVATVTVTATHEVTQPDLDLGFVYNLATATGKDPSGADVTATSIDPNPCVTCPVDPNCPSCTVVPMEQNGKLSVTKSADRTKVYSKEGDVIGYDIVVRNTGNVTLTDVTISDINAVLANGGSVGTLAPNATATITASHSVTQDDIDNGYVYNLATVTGKDPSNSDVTAASTDPSPCAGCTVDPNCPSCTIVPVEQNGKLSLAKSADRTKVYSKVGDLIEYEIIVTNTGNVTLTDVTISDINAVLANGGSVGTLAPNATATIMASHSVAQPDLDRGFVYNLATVRGKNPSNSEVSATSIDPNPCVTCPVDPNCPACTIVPVQQNGKLEITKSADRIKTYSKEGDVIGYAIVVTNTGNVTLTDVTVSDANAVLANGGSVGTLAPNATATITASHSVTQPDIDRGFVYNLATVTGKDPANSEVTVTAASTDPNPCSGCTIDPACPDCTVVPMEQNGSLSVTKSADRTKVYSKVGDIIEYTVWVKNTGNVTLFDVTLRDDNADGKMETTYASLLPGRSQRWQVEHTVAPEDIAAGYVYNFVLAEAETLNGKTITAESTDPDPCTECPVDPACPACTTVRVEQMGAGSMAMIKTALVDGDRLGVDDVIEYEIVVTNTGKVALRDIAVTDDRADVFLVGRIAELGVGENRTLRARHTITREDVARRYVSNIALAVGKDPSSAEVTAASESIGRSSLDSFFDPDCPRCTITPIPPRAIAAVNDGLAQFVYRDEGAVPSVLENDVLDGATVDPTEVRLTWLAPAPYGLTLNPDGTVDIAPDTPPGTYKIGYRICDVLDPGNCSEAMAAIEVRVSDLFIPNIFTPNGDGVNDTFEILGMENFDWVGVIIFNRWGHEIYRSDRYTNGWDGSNLNEGSYYYNVRAYRSGVPVEIIKGWVMIKSK